MSKYRFQNRSDAEAAHDAAERMLQRVQRVLGAAIEAKVCPTKLPGTAQTRVKIPGESTPLTLTYWPEKHLDGLIGVVYAGANSRCPVFEDAQSLRKRMQNTHDGRELYMAAEWIGRQIRIAAGLEQPYVTAALDREYATDRA